MERRLWKMTTMDVRKDHTVIWYEDVLTGDSRKVIHWFDKSNKLLSTTEEVFPKEPVENV